MKLQKKINYYFFSISLIIFLLSTIISYFVLKKLILEEVDETLEAEKNNLIIQLKAHDNLEKLAENHSYRLEISPQNSSELFQKLLNDTTIYVSEKEETVPFRQLKIIENINGKNYLIILRRSLIEQDDLIIGITSLLIGIFFLIIAALNLINYFGEKIWWSPFKDTLKQLLNFQLSQNKSIKLHNSDIDEFNELNKTIKRMTDKLITDYKNLKEFSENASHEMQTPLAIIRSKLDVIIQDKSLSKKQLISIHSIYPVVNRLAILNRSLNLLTKIENQEFENKENVNFSELIHIQLSNLSELIEANSLQVKTDITEGVIIYINIFIAETLISNLMMNAVKHNMTNGNISILLNNKQLTIKNNGEPPTVSTDELFNKFKKSNQTSNSPGLGLSIVKNICEQYGFDIQYNFKSDLHVIEIIF
jgi:signal transduction histidine kinase